MKKFLFMAFYVLWISIGIQFVTGCGPTLPQIQESEKKKLAVLDFAKSNKEQDLGSPMAAMITSELFKLNIFHIVERNEVKSLLNEVSLSQTGIIEKDAAQLRKIAGVDYLIVGDAFLIKNKVQVDIRLIDTETGKIMTVISDKDNEDDLRNIAKRVSIKLVDAVYKR